MRILYGAFSQGNGHLSKASVLVPLLEARGHEVRVVTSGPPPTKCYEFTWHRHFPGIAYATKNGQTDYLKSFKQWSRALPTLLKGIWAIRRIAREFQPDLVVSDFEPMTASPLVEPRCEVVAISRQVSLLDPDVPMPPTGGFDRKMTRSVIRVFTCGADRKYGYHYEPASFRCVPPLTRAEAKLARPELGDHIVMYCGLPTFRPSAEDVVSWARKNNQRVVAYGYPRDLNSGDQQAVSFRNPNPQQFLEDMATSRGVITTAGLSTPVEAFLLRKPLVVVPIPRQWEQTVNAFQLEQAAIARSVPEWDLDKILDVPAPEVDHPLLSWMRTDSEFILDRILDEETAMDSSSTSEQAQSAA